VDCVKNSLERLQLDYIDVIIIHRVDPMCPMEEIVRALTHVINHGWVMYWGTSKWTPVEIMEAYSNCRQFNCITPILEQAEYHFFCRDKPELYMTELYNKIGVGLMTWSPLTMSFYKALGKNPEDSMALAMRCSIKSWGKERSSSTDEASTAKQLHQQKLSREIAALAEKHGCSLSQLVIAWCLKNDPVQCMLIGPTSTPELLSYLQALQLIPKLSTTVMNELEKILDNRPVRPPMVSTLAMSQR
jgi:voltage-dependent potassium channel beta subunit